MYKRLIMFTLLCVFLFVLLAQVSSVELMNIDMPQLQGSTISHMKHTFARYDFTQVPLQDRIDVYQQAKVSIVWPVFKNLLFGFGKGSQLQHDRSTEWFGIISDAATLSVASIGVGLFIFDFLLLYPLYAISGESYGFGSSDPITDIALYSMCIGGGAFVVGRIVQAIMPLIHGPRYNRILRNGLGLTKDEANRMEIALGVNPVINKDLDVSTGIQLTASIGF